MSNVRSVKLKLMIYDIKRTGNPALQRHVDRVSKTTDDAGGLLQPVLQQIGFCNSVHSVYRELRECTRRCPSLITLYSSAVLISHVCVLCEHISAFSFTYYKRLPFSLSEERTARVHRRIYIYK